MKSMKIFNSLKFWNSSLANTSDEELMLMVKCSQDDRAFRSLYETHKACLYLFVKNIVFKAQVAEEITHDSFYKVWSKRESYNADYRFKSWLWTIARNTAYDYLRKRGEFSLEEVESWEERISNDVNAPFEELLKKNKSEHIKESVAKLPLNLRESIVLWSLGFSIKEMSKQLNVNEQIVKNRIYRGKNKLIELINKEIIDEK